jgi:endonuclease III
LSPVDLRKKRANDVRRRLERAMPKPECELEHRNAWQLVVATILSAQSTDKTVNRVTPTLFARYPTPAALGSADRADVEHLVRATGFFRNKAKAICEASRLIAERHGGEAPRTLEELIELPGVARKTANVVLGTAYGISSGMAVDTHATRVSQRLELTHDGDAVKIERDLCALFPESTWIDMSHRLILHGRYVCLSRKPDCPACPLNELCPSAQAKPEGTWTTRAKREGERIIARGEPG